MIAVDPFTEYKNQTSELAVSSGSEGGIRRRGDVRIGQLQDSTDPDERDTQTLEDRAKHQTDVEPGLIRST